MNRRVCSAVVVVVLLVGVAFRADAALVTFSFSGSVTEVDGNIATGVNVGDVVTGSGAYDTAAPNTAFSPGRFFAAFSSGDAYLTVDVHATLGVLSFTVGPGTSGDPIYLYDWDQSAYSPGDYFEFGGNNNSGIGMPEFTSGLFNQVDLNFEDQTPPYNMLDGVSPPAGGLPDLTKVTSQGPFVRGFSRDEGNYDIVFALDTPSAVPEPATLAIWSLGAIGCAIAGYRRQRTKMPR